MQNIQTYDSEVYLPGLHRNLLRVNYYYVQLFYAIYIQYLIIKKTHTQNMF